MNSLYAIPGGESNMLDRSAVGVLGNGELWPRMGVLRKRGGRGCRFWKVDVGEAGEEPLESGCDKLSSDCSALELAVMAVIMGPAPAGAKYW